MKEHNSKKSNSLFIIRNSYREGGFAALLSVLVVSIVALTISVSISLLGVGEAKNSLDYKRGQEVLKIAEGCVEEALLRLRNDDTYSGGSLNVGDGLCNINISGSGADRVIDVVGQIQGPPSFEKSIQVNVRRSGNSINIVNWSEI